MHVGMTVARKRTQIVQEGDFDHAVDNSSDSVGLVADWIAVTRRWRSHPPAACSRGGDSNHQPRDWPTSCINPHEVPCCLWLLTTDNTDYSARLLFAGP